MGTGYDQRYNGCTHYVPNPLPTNRLVLTASPVGSGFTVNPATPVLPMVTDLDVIPAHGEQVTTALCGSRLEVKRIMYAYANNSFYPFSMREVYEASDSWPIKYIEVGESVFTEFSASPPVGKIRGTGDNGMPAWVDIPPPTQGELIAQAERENNTALILLTNL